MSSSNNNGNNSSSSSSTSNMGSVLSLFAGFVLGVSCTAAGAAYLFFYGAEHLGPVVRKKFEEKKAEQEIVLKAITNRGESIVYPLTGIHTSPPIHRLGETNLCLRMSGGILSIYQPERNSSSGVAKHRSASIMQVLAQFHVDTIIVHAITSSRIEIEALSNGTDAICDVSFGSINVPAHRICIDFYYRHEAAEVFSRCVSGGAGAVGSSVFLRNSYRHVPAFYKFIAGLPSNRLSPATVLLARILGASNDVRALKPFILSKLKKKLDKVVLPSPVKGTLEVADLKLGHNSPAIGDIRLVNTPLQPTDGSVELAVDIEYSGGLELALNVEIEVDSFISVKVPSVTVTIKIQKLSGVLRLLAIPPPAKDLWIAFEKTPDIKIGFAQRVNGGNSIVKVLAAKIPDLSEIVTDVVKTSLLSDMVLPNRDDIPMPIIGDTPPNTPAEPENDASVFEAFRDTLPKSTREKGRMSKSFTSPSNNSSPSSSTTNFLSTSGSANSSPGAARTGNFKDDDIIFNRSNNSETTSPTTAQSSNTTPQFVPNKVQKRTIHINDTKDFTDLNTSVSAKAKQDAEKMRRDLEEQTKNQKDDKKQNEATTEKAKKDSEEPSLIDRFLSPSDDSSKNKKRNSSISSTSSTPSQQQKSSGGGSENNKQEEKGFFDRLHDKYDEYKQKKEEEEKAEREKKEKKESRSVSPSTTPPTTNTTTTNKTNTTNTNTNEGQQEKGFFDRMSDKYHEWEHERDEEKNKKTKPEESGSSRSTSEQQRTAVVAAEKKEEPPKQQESSKKEKKEEVEEKKEDEKEETKKDDVVGNNNSSSSAASAASPQSTLSTQPPTSTTTTTTTESPSSSTSPTSQNDKKKEDGNNLQQQQYVYTPTPATLQSQPQW